MDIPVLKLRLRCLNYKLTVRMEAEVGKAEKQVTSSDPDKSMTQAWFRNPEHDFASSQGCEGCPGTLPVVPALLQG